MVVRRRQLMCWRILTRGAVIKDTRISGSSIQELEVFSETFVKPGGIVFIAPFIVQRRLGSWAARRSE